MDDLNFLHSEYDRTGDTDRPIIVLVEDDQTLALPLKIFLERKLKLELFYFSSPAECLENLTVGLKGKKVCLITDITFDQGTDGLGLIDILKERQVNFFSIVMTGFGSIESAIAATRKGVFHYLTKPFELEDLYQLVCEGLKKNFNLESPDANKTTSKTPTFLDKNKNLLRVERPKEEDLFCGMIGRSQAMKDIFSRITKVAKSDSTVFITGPSGTGKELVARAIHQLSSRVKNNLVGVNCGAIPSELLESELFGHIKGSFTGAISDRKGRFESAHQGTIFLDEIGDMPLHLQVKLLRVLQNKEIEPVGFNGTRKIDVRVITATHQDLDELVNTGGFREDLFYRLNVIPIKIPPLNQRKEDIPLLISFFLSRFVSADGRNQVEISDEALKLILSYDWPGNVRELENLIERLVILRGGNVILPEHLPAKIYRNNPLAKSMFTHMFQLPDEGVDLKKTLSEIEDSLIIQALGRTQGNKNQASKLLLLNRTTLIEKMKKKGLDSSNLNN